MNRYEQEQLLGLLQEKERREKYRKVDYLFTDTGEFSRTNYRKAVQFMQSTSQFSEVMFSGGNQTGKTTTLCTLATYWLTGEYPTWYTGKPTRP